MAGKTKKKTRKKAAEGKQAKPIKTGIQEIRDLVAMKDYTAAQMIVEKLLKDSPDSDSLWKLKGDILEAAGDIKGAKHCYDWAISIVRKDIYMLEQQGMDIQEKLKRKKGIKSRHRYDVDGYA